MTEQTETIENNVQPLQKNICKLVWLQLACVAGIILLYILIISDVLDPVMDNGWLRWGAYVLLLAIPFLGIAALIRISLRREQLKGIIGSFLMIAVSGYFIFNATYYEVPRAEHGGPTMQIVCRTNMHGLGTVLQLYAREHDGSLPESNWCDVLIEETDVSPKSFKCPTSDSVVGESDYCLNRFAAGRDLKSLPDDMVLLFEAMFTPGENETRQPIRQREGFDKLTLIPQIFRGDEQVYLDCWNQVGGPEILNHTSHKDGCNVLFADGSSQFVTRAQMPSLRWDIENKVKFTISESQFPPVQKAVRQTFVLSFENSLMNTLLVSVSIVSVFIIVRFRSVRFLPFIAVLSMLSAATGWLFGGWSEDAYVYIRTHGSFAGLFFGLFIGICFAAILSGTLNKTKHIKAFVLLALSTGTLTGVICSTLVHLALMIIYRTANPFGIFIGIPYGIFAGALLGLVSGIILKQFYLKNPFKQKRENNLQTETQ